MNSKSFLALILLLMLSITACSDGNKPVIQKNNLVSADIYSDRPLNEKSTFSILKLKSPALLAVATRSNGALQVTSEDIARINQEHEEMVAKLQAISSEIRILFHYKLVLNAISIVLPIEVAEQVQALDEVSAHEDVFEFSAPVAPLAEGAITQALDLANTSVSFIGADKLHDQGVRGQGMRIGIIDTGIDYTHSMLGGPGSQALYNSINPSEFSMFFPNDKVVGGIDLVGTKYNTASAIFEERVPRPDQNPIDEAGHGTHVAGTVAGIGDNIISYDGVAPDAKLYAIKVFGAAGSTSSMVVIAALEYAADPNGDMHFDDRLNVVNLSLGGGKGKPGDLYSQAIDQLTTSGTIVVASAGNSGEVDYIVGSPSTANSALSVAASIDNMAHNWQFDSSSFDLGEDNPLVVQTIEGPTTKPIAQNIELSGKLVHIGTAATDLTPEQINNVRGNVALIDRGVSTFDEKIQRAQAAGAIGVVVANNQAGAAFAMGGTGEFTIPGFMITQAQGDLVKSKMTSGQNVIVRFRHDTPVVKPELIDTLTTFSSRGPRNYDSAIKPEIAAPGQQIISAAVGGGAQVTRMNGTSMSSPHMAGVMGLMRQLHPDLSSDALKSLVMGSAKTLKNNSGDAYSVAYQGSGRVQLEQAAQLKFFATPASLSLGETGIMGHKKIRRKITLNNVSSETITLTSSLELARGLEVKAPEQVTIAANSNTEITVEVAMTSDYKHGERDAFLAFTNGEQTIHIPMLAVSYKLSDISASKLAVYASHESESDGAAVDLTLKNTGTSDSEVFLFNLLGTGARRTLDASDLMKFNCNLQSAGYRVIEKDGEQILQFAIKLYGAITTWEDCEVAVLIDGNNDGVHDQELAGTMLSNISGITSKEYSSVLLDAVKVRELRQAHEIAVLSNSSHRPNYVPAVIDNMAMQVYQHSTLAFVSVKTSKLAKTENGQLRFKLAVLHAYLGDDNFLQDEWANLNLNTLDAPYMDLPEVVKMSASSEKVVPLTKGQAKGDLVIYAPDNARSQSAVIEDRQQLLIPATYNP